MVLDLPGPTWTPFAAALCFAALFLGVLTQAYAVAVAGAVAALAFLGPLEALAQGKVKIGTLGSGRVASGIGASWVRAGHEVMFSSLDIENDKKLAASIGAGARAARSSFISASTVCGVGSTISKRRLCVRISNCSRLFLSTCGERFTVNFSMRVGSGIGPRT